MMKKIFFIGIFIVALLYRSPNLQTPFWVDEFSTARNALLYQRFGLAVFSQHDELFEHHNVTEHALVSLFFQLFGKTETAARLPSVIIGSFVPVAVFLLSRLLYDRQTALAATLLTMFSYFQITWSRQARSYMLLQLLILLSLWTYHRLVKHFELKKLVLLTILMMLGVVTHTTYWIVVAGILLHAVYLGFHWHLFSLLTLRRFWKIGFFFGFLFIVLICFNGASRTILYDLILSVKTHPNNLWYYHSFLWREQTLISFLAGLGVLINFFQYKKGTFLLVVPTGLFLVFVSFVFGPYVSRYILPIYPLVLILAGFTLATVSQSIAPKKATLVVLLIAFFIIANGDTFVLKPKAYYSVNHDMREIALLDYDQVYSIIKQKVMSSSQPVAIVDTWPDRARWYLGYENPNMFYFHWENEQGTVNGLAKTTAVTVINGEKVLPNFINPAIRFVGSIEDFQKVMHQYRQGFIWIDDSSLPADVAQYAEENLQVEIQLDHYPLDDNPYSIWPGTLYSWGFE